MVLEKNYKSGEMAIVSTAVVWDSSGSSLIFLSENLYYFLAVKE